MMTSASVVEDMRPTIPGGSLAEQLFQYPARTPVRCAECGLRIFEIIGENIFLHTRHYNQKHYSVIPLKDIGLRLA